jgi:hypothetical protein
MHASLSLPGRRQRRAEQTDLYLLRPGGKLAGSRRSDVRPTLAGRLIGVSAPRPTYRHASPVGFGPMRSNLTMAGVMPLRS